MRLNKATTHAIRALVACAASEGVLIKVSDLAEQMELTQQNAFKIVHLLSRAGFLQATRGRHGGVMLSRPADDIRVGDVVRGMEELSFDSEDGDRGAGSLGVIDEAFEAFIAVLNKSTIADMAKAGGSASTKAGAKAGGRKGALREAARKSAKPGRKVVRAMKPREPRRSVARV